jgi:diacylglycerol kinase (ATP)
MHNAILMRICLYWNAGAGDQTPLAAITSDIESAGHEIVRVLKHDDEDIAIATQLRVDAVVAAGGDGTVARVARALVASDLPIAILPLGTANNIATSLGINDDPVQAIGQWRHQRKTHIDIGVVTDRDGEHLFVEGTGIGLVPRGIQRGRDHRRPLFADAAAELTWARGMFLEALDDLTPRPSSICIDGETIEGEFLLVEVLNIASVGPRLRLSAETAPADGLLSVVIAIANDHEAIRAHLRQPWSDDDTHAWLKSWRARRIDVTGWHEYHVDDQVYRSDSGTATIAIRPLAVAVLA